MGCKDYTICPSCGKHLFKIEDGYNMSVCINSSCRTFIQDGVIGNIDLDTYARLQEKYNMNKSDDKSDKAFMLLKENLSGPKFDRNTNEPTMKYRNTYCIIKATDKKNAIEQFRQKYKVIKITEDMVVEVEIREV